MARQPVAILGAWLWIDWRRFQLVSLILGDQIGLAYSRLLLRIDL